METRALFRIPKRPVPTGPFGVPGQGLATPLERKAVTFAPSFLWRMSGGTFEDVTASADPELAGSRAYAVAALAYICIRYRAQKIREAPIMVVEESAEGEAWVENHALAGLLARPNPDYGMARLIEATETFLCTTGRCLWVKNRDRARGVASLYPFGGDEFTIERANGRLFGRFRVNGREFAPEDVVYFAYFDPADPLGGVAPLDAAMSHLGIAHTLQSRIRAHVRNAMAPGGIYVADKDWRATDEEFARLKQELAVMTAGANTGKSGIAEGGGKFERGWSLADLALGELWREAEAVVCACFGVPAALVGTVIGLENSPWSHLETAKRSFYDETILPEWEMLEGVLTESLLRETDADPAHLIRFDTSRIRALQADLAAASLRASTIQLFTSVNERRVVAGFPALDDAKADEIPELARVSVSPAGTVDDEGEAPASTEEPSAGAEQDIQVTQQTVLNGAQISSAKDIVLAVAAGQLPRDSGVAMLQVFFNLAPEKAEQLMGSAGTTTPTTPNPITGSGSGAQQPAAEPTTEAAAPAPPKASSRSRLAEIDRVADAEAAAWETVAARLLGRDQERIASAIARALPAKAAGDTKERAPKLVRDRVYRAFEAAMDESTGEWQAAVRPLLSRTAEAGVYATVVPDTGISYRLLRPHLGSFIERESAFLITSVSDTTRQAVRDVLKEVLDDGQSPAVAARRIRDLAGFSRERAKLIARTETTRTLNGAPLEALTQYATTTGSKFVKRWSATLDDRVRDEHAAMHGEEVPIDGVFSNGLAAPSEPNCRCALTYGLAGGTE